VGCSTLAVAAALIGPVACGSSSGDAPPAGGSVSPADFTYRGEGCLYDVTLPERNGFVEPSLDTSDAPGSVPARVRLGLGGGTKSGASGYADPARTVAVTWETPEPTRAARLRIGPTPDALAPVPGYSWTTPAPDVGFGSNEPATSMHEVHVCGLDPGRTYYYAVGGGSPEVWSDVQSFTTVPATGKITVGVLGDARDKVDVWQTAQRRMRSLGVNLQITTGDLVFTGTQQSLYDEWLGAIWKDPATPGSYVTLGQQLMVMVAGNHENDAARFFGAFALPGTGPFAETYASFDAVNTHFVVFDDQPLALLEGSEHANATLAWLREDLAAADRNRDAVPFVVVVHHRGLFTTSSHADDNDVLDLRRTLAPIYDENHVDLVVNGHDHAYERSKVLRAGADPRGAPVITEPGKGTLYVVNAGAGASAYGVGEAPFIEKSQTFGKGTAFDGLYGVITLEGRRLTMTSYGISASGTDPVIDSFDLSR
jgi:acid phosphatase type 7